MFDMSMLDRQALDQGETKMKPYPVTDGTLVQVKEGKFTGGEKNGKQWARYDVTLEFQDEVFIKSAGRQPGATIRYGIMVDLDDSGQIALGDGRNIRLNRFRAACGVNKPGKSLSDCVGCYLKAAIGHRDSGEVDPEDGSPIVYSDVKEVTKA